MITCAHGGVGLALLHTHSHIMRDLGKESILAAFALDVSHQEVARIIDELEQSAQDVFNAAGREAWVPILAATNIVCHDLGVCTWNAGSYVCQRCRICLPQAQDTSLIIAL